MSAAATLKNHKIAISLQRLTDLRHFEKSLNRHISATIWLILMKFGKMTHIGPLQWTELQFWIFENPRWRWSLIWKSQKLPYLSNNLTDVHENLVWWCKMGLLISPLKHLNFKNPRWWTAAILKTVKSPHLRNSFDQFWWILVHFAYWSSESDVKYSFNFWQSYMAHRCLQCIDAVGWATGRASGL